MYDRIYFYDNESNVLKCIENVLQTIIPDVKPLSASEVHMGDEDSEAESGEASDGGEAGQPAPDSTTSPSPGGGRREEGEVGNDECRSERKVREATPVQSTKQRRRSKSPDQSEYIIINIVYFMTCLVLKKCEIIDVHSF